MPFPLKKKYSDVRYLMKDGVKHAAIGKSRRCSVGMRRLLKAVVLFLFFTLVGIQVRETGSKKANPVNLYRRPDHEPKVPPGLMTTTTENPNVVHGKLEDMQDAYQGDRPRVSATETSDANSILIVGAGLSGAVMAHLHAVLLNKKIIVIDKRDHIAGNCFDYKNELDILVSKYGAHLFHTNDETVWRYVLQFGEWSKYEHRVIARIKDLYIPMPPNIQSVNLLLNETIHGSAGFRKWLAKERILTDDPKNGKEAALSRVGPRLYRTLFETYTKKQWDKDPSELDASVLKRIPVVENFDDRYFPRDKYHAVPTHGYTEFIQAILTHPNIMYMTEVDYFKNIEQYASTKYERTIFTGPIDAYFSDHGLPKLEYRSINFQSVNYPNISFFQPSMVVNYPASLEQKFTRIVEPKHLLSQQSFGTTIILEYSTDKGDPYYPVPNKKNQDLYNKYKNLAIQEEKEKNVFFIGRLANYKYFNMDQAIGNAIEEFIKMYPKFQDQEKFEPAFGSTSPQAAETYLFNKLPSISVVIARKNESLAWLQHTILHLCNEQQQINILVYNLIEQSKMIHRLEARFPKCNFIQEVLHPRVNFKELAFMYHLLSRTTRFRDINVFLRGNEPTDVNAMVNHIANQVKEFGVGSNQEKPNNDLSNHYVVADDSAKGTDCIRTSDPEFHKLCQTFKLLMTTNAPCTTFTIKKSGEFAVTEALLRRALGRARTGMVKLYSNPESWKMSENTEMLRKLWHSMFKYPNLPSCS